MLARMKLPAIIVALALIATGVTGITVLARTSSIPAPTAELVDYQGPGFFYPATLQRLSQLLGLSTQEITTQLGEGKSLLSIAQTKNIAEDRLVTVLVGPEEEILQVQVKNGFLTDAQAKARSEWLRTRAAQTVRFSWSNAAGPSAQGANPYGWGHNPEDCPMYGGSGFGGGMMGWGMMGGGTVVGGMMGQGMMGWGR